MLGELPPAVDTCGERGGLHTFCFDGPMFARAIPPSGALSLATSSATSPLSKIELLQVSFLSVVEATNFGRVLSAVAISSAGSVDFGHEPAKIS